MPTTRVTASKTKKVTRVPEQRSIFDQMESIVADFVVCLCKYDKSNKNWCKQWNGKSSVTDAVAAIECPVKEDKFDKCRYYVVGKACRKLHDAR